MKDNYKECEQEVPPLTKSERDQIFDILMLSKGSRDQILVEIRNSVRRLSHVDDQTFNRIIYNCERILLSRIMG